MKRVVALTAMCLLLLVSLVAFAACGNSEDITPPAADPLPPAGDQTELMFEVVFRAGDGTVLKIEEVKQGDGATAPEVPARDGYEFTGWDVAFDCINGDTTVTAQYVRVFTVTFADHAGDAIQTLYVREGEGAEAPEVPARPRYSFIGWDKNFDHITDDTIITAVYNEIGKVTVVFADYDGSCIATSDILWGAAATAPAAPVHEGYTFVSWDKRFDAVTSHMIVTAVYREAGKHLVTFRDHDGTILSYENVEAGEDATPPAAPVRVGHTFAGWDGSYTAVSSDTEVTAQYNVSETFTVTFVNEKDSVLKTQTVYAREAATAPIPPIKDGYIFTGWEQDFSSIVSDVTIKAQYAVIKHNVIFYLQQADKFISRKVSDGRRVSAPGDPTRDGFIFVEWQADGKVFDFTAPIKKDINVYATYKTDGTVPTATHASLFVTPDYLEVWSGITLQLEITSAGSEIGFVRNSGATFEFVSTEPAIVTVDAKGNFTTHEVGRAEIYAVAKTSGSAGGQSVKSGDIIKATTIYVVETPEYYKLAMEQDDQKITLGGTTTSRIDKHDFLNYPTGDYGAANISLWYQDAQAAFTLTVDDNVFVTADWEQWETWYQTYGIPVTYTVWSDRNAALTAEGKLWRELIAQGHDVQTHGADHITITKNTCSARVWYDMYFGQKQLRRVTGQDQLSIGYANGTNMESVSSLLFVGGRGVVGHLNAVDQVNYNYTNAYNTIGSSATNMISKLFGTGSDGNGWACILYHGIDLSAFEHSERETIENCLKELAPYVADGRLWAALYSDVLMYGQERDTAKIIMNEVGVNKICFTLTDEMNDLLYCQPLSIRVKVNSTWEQICAFQNGEQIPSRVVEKDGETYLMIDAVPDRGEITAVRMRTEMVKNEADEVSFNPKDYIGIPGGAPMVYTFTVTDDTWNDAVATQAGAVLPVEIKEENGIKRVCVTCLINAGVVTVTPGGS